MKVRTTDLEAIVPPWFLAESMGGGHVSHLSDPVDTYDTECSVCARMIAESSVEFVPA